MPTPPISVTIDARSTTVLGKMINSLTPAQLMQALLKLFTKLGAQAAGYIVRNKLSGTSGVLATRSGQLKAGIVGDGVIRNGLPGIRCGVFRGPALRYAGVQELGTRPLNPDSPYDTIEPVNAKALAMPVNDALTPAGVARYNGPRGYPGELKFIPFRNSGVAVGMLVDKTQLVKSQAQARLSGTKWNIRDVRALYILLRKTDIPPAYYLRDGMREFLPTVAGLIAKYLAEFIRSGNVSSPE